MCFDSIIFFSTFGVIWLEGNQKDREHGLVGGFNNLEKYESQWEGWHPIYEMENKSHVWNHQPVEIAMLFVYAGLHVQFFPRGLQATTTATTEREPAGRDAIWLIDSLHPGGIDMSQHSLNGKGIPFPAAGIRGIWKSLYG